LSKSKSKSKSKFKRFSLRNERPKPISIIREEEIITTLPDGDEDGPIDFKAYDEDPIHYSMDMRNLGDGESPGVLLRTSGNNKPTDQSILEVEANFEDDSRLDTLSLANREPKTVGLKRPDSPRFPPKKTSPASPNSMAFSPKSSQQPSSASP